MHYFDLLFSAVQCSFQYPNTGMKWLEHTLTETDYSKKKKRNFTATETFYPGQSHSGLEPTGKVYWSAAASL